MELRSEVYVYDKDNSYSRARISHGLNKSVTNLKSDEQEIPEVQIEEYAFKLDTKVMVCPSKATAKTQGRELFGFSEEHFLFVR